MEERLTDALADARLVRELLSPERVQAMSDTPSVDRIVELLRAHFAPHREHAWVQRGHCIYCECGVRLGTGRLRGKREEPPHEWPEDWDGALKEPTR